MQPRCIARAARKNEVAPEQTAQVIVLQVGPRAAQVVGAQQLLQARPAGRRLRQRQKRLPQARAAGQVGAQGTEGGLAFVQAGARAGVVYQPLQAFLKQRRVSAAQGLQRGHHRLGPGLLGPAVACQLHQVGQRRIGPMVDLCDVEQRQVAAAVFEVGQRLPSAQQQVQAPAVHLTQAAQNARQGFAQRGRALLKAADQAEDALARQQAALQRRFKLVVRRHIAKPALAADGGEVFGGHGAHTVGRLDVQHRAFAVLRAGALQQLVPERWLAPVRGRQQQGDGVRHRLGQLRKHFVLKRSKRLRAGGLGLQRKLGREPCGAEQPVGLALGQAQIARAGHQLVARARVGHRDAVAPVVDGLAAQADLGGHARGAGANAAHVDRQEVGKRIGRHVWCGGGGITR